MTADFICGAPTAPAQVVRVLAQLKECCVAAYEDGAHACTCWEPIYDQEQAPVDETAEPTTRKSMCEDCAYAPGSPERSGDDRYSHSDEDMTTLENFWCHQGMRKPTRWRHASLGIEVPADSDAYDPPRRIMVIDGVRQGVPYKADGSPGERCAGWAAHQRARRAEAAVPGGAGFADSVEGSGG